MRGLPRLLRDRPPSLLTSDQADRYCPVVTVLPTISRATARTIDSRETECPSE